MVQSLFAVLRMSVAVSFTVSERLRNVLPTETSIVNQEAQKRLVCMSPPELPLTLAVTIHPCGKERVLSR